MNIKLSPCHAEDGACLPKAGRSIDHRLSTTKLVSTLILISSLIIFLTSCSEDDKPKTLATVSTLAPTDITTTTAIVRGEISNDGNAKITESGFVYSNAIANPTTSDDKIVVEADDEDMLEVLLEGLTSGSTYHIRAYAINSEGVAYGTAMEFETGNAAPVAEDVSIEGDLIVGQELTGIYTYVDAEEDAEAGTTYQWYSSANGTGSDAVAIVGATDQTYVVQDEDATKSLQFRVTPKAAAGTLVGIETNSPFTLGIGDETEVTFMYMGEEVTYGIIKSTVTNRKWLDRNLGAGAAPNASNDWANYGDLFQWGRAADGHQVVVRNGSWDTDSGCTPWIGDPINPVYATSDTPNDAFYRPNMVFPFDWRNPQNENLWQGVNGKNNPCPSGWRIPTKSEWEAEAITTLAGAYTQLKITLTGERINYSQGCGGNGILENGFTACGSLDYGRYWSSTTGLWTIEDNAPASYRIGFKHPNNGGNVIVDMFARSNAAACRCIKD